MAVFSFLIARKDDSGRWQRVATAEIRKAGFATCLTDAGDRRQVENACRFILTDSAICSVDTISGYRVSQM